MANFYGQARSNYFKVKDLEAFRAALGEHCEIVEEGDTVAVFPNDENDDGMFPSSVYNEETDEDEDVDIFGLIADHLQENSVAVFMGIGSEKLRYLDGWAVAYDNGGEIASVNLNSILDLAKAQRPNKEITDCSY